MQIKDIIRELETFAPLIYQEAYDNCGLQVGDAEALCHQALLCLDVTEAVIEEAITRQCQLIIAHHPLLFSGVKRLTGRHYTERILMKAIKHDVAVYAMHTNLDNVYLGVNHKIAARIGLQNTRILAPNPGKLLKLITYVPENDAEVLMEALFAAGMGRLGAYTECSFRSPGQGTFRPGQDTHPAIGQPDGPRETVHENRLEVLVPQHLKDKALATLQTHHPYEEVAYELIPLENEHQYLGAGMTGELSEPLSAGDFLRKLKTDMKLTCIRHTELPDKLIRKVAVCGGSGSFLLPRAIAQGADIFITGDFKYHQFFDADSRIIIADIGHYESEQFTIEIFSEILKKKFPNFALLFTQVNTNPVNYYF